MKKYFPILLLFVACSKKSLPVITNREAEKPNVFKEIYPPEGTVKPDLAEGKILFTNRCGRCHGLPETAAHTTEDWENILATMIPKAKLSKEQAVHVRAYVLANAGK